MPKPSKKQKVKTSDQKRLEITHEKVRVFNLRDRDEQLSNLKTHLIDIGSQRRNNFRNLNINFVQNSSDSDSE